MSNGHAIPERFRDECPMYSAEQITTHFMSSLRLFAWWIVRCIACPSGHYVEPSNVTCVPCPPDTVVTSINPWGIESCVKCGRGLRPFDGRRCVPLCRYVSETDQRLYDWTSLAGSVVLSALLCWISGYLPSVFVKMPEGKRSLKVLESRWRRWKHNEHSLNFKQQSFYLLQFRGWRFIGKNFVPWIHKLITWAC